MLHGRTSSPRNGRRLQKDHIRCVLTLENPFFEPFSIITFLRMNCSPPWMVLFLQRVMGDYFFLGLGLS
jgi:hypothetical protein